MFYELAIAAYLAVDDPARLTHADFVRLAFARPTDDHIESPASASAFRHSMRQTFETFLRFTHRYWFHEV